MNIDSDTAHIFSRALMAFGFLLAMICFARVKRFGLALFYLVATIETYAKLRYPFLTYAHYKLMNALPPGVGKANVQWTLIAISGVAAIAVVVWYVLRQRSEPFAKLFATFWTFCVVALVVIELISPIQLDRFIYSIDGPFVRMAWMYFVCAAMASWGTIWAKSKKDNR